MHADFSILNFKIVISFFNVISAGEDIAVRDSYKFLIGQGSHVLRRGDPGRLPFDRPVTEVPYTSSVSEIRLLGFDPDPACQSLFVHIEDVSALLHIVAEHLSKLLRCVVRELEPFRESAVQTGVGGEELLHLIGVAGEYDSEVVTVVLYLRYQRRHGFSSVAVLLIAHERISLIDEEYTPESALDLFLDLGGSLAHMLSDQVGSRAFHECVGALQQTYVIVDGDGVPVDYEGEKVDAQLAFSTAAAEATLGGAFTAPTLTATLEDESLKTSIKYESSDKTVATVDESTGKVTLLKAGVTNISATVVNDTYKGSAYYKLTVVNPIKGDANSDEKVDAADIVAFINYMKGEPSAKFNKVAADVNNDGNVNYVDVKEIKNIIFGKSRPAATATAGDVGKLICTAGHIHAYSSDDGCTADRVALIISVGGYTGNPIYKHGLALALADESSTMDWTTAKATVEAHSPTVAYAEWMLPDWELLVNAFGGGHYAKNLRESFSSVGGTNILVGYYWDKEEWGSGLSALAECYIFYEDYSSAGLSGSPYLDNKTMLYNVRACLAF